MIDRDTALKKDGYDNRECYNKIGFEEHSQFTKAAYWIESLV